MSFTPPSTSDTNNEYIIATILTDPDLSSLFTLANYNQQWNKASLIQTIQEILANGTSTTNPLIPQKHTVSPPIITSSPDSQKSSTLNLNANNEFNKNIMTVSDNNSNTYNLVNTGNNYEGKDGNITMQVNNQSILQGSDINVVYNIPKITDMDAIMDSSGNYISRNTGSQKCLYKTLCTKKHFYKPNCETVIKDDGNCACNCSPEEIYNESGKPHMHCETKDLSNTILNYLDDITSIEMSFPVSYTSNNPATITYDPDIDYLSNLIADYYILLLQNDSKQVNKNETGVVNDSKTQSKHQLYEDANELYQDNYTKIINISVGIILSSYVIYAILKK